MKTELYECANCNHIGPCNTHGRCSHCDSTAVVSLERIELVLIRTRPDLSFVPA